MRRARRFLALGLAALAGAGPAAAQSDWARVAVPTYSLGQVMRGLHGHWTAPRADEFAQQAQALSPALQQLCEAPPASAAERLRQARDRWRGTTTAWERLSAVPLGPVVERRSMRQIDFTPTRPALILKAIESAPQGAAAMERIGTPAKGLPALEWMLWSRPPAAGSAACRDAIELAADIEREAAALRLAFRGLAEREADDWSDEAAVNGMNEFVSQWVGGVERLRWAQMEKPLRAGTREGLPRALSASTAVSWTAHWEALRTLAVFQGRAAPVPGAGLVPLETVLRGRGLNPLADQLLRTVRRVGTRLRLARPGESARVLETARELAALKRLAEARLAPALEVSIGFSDADGD